MSQDRQSLIGCQTFSTESAEEPKFDAYRQDRHQVIVVIALPPNKGPTTVMAREQRFATVSELERQRQIANDVAITSIGRNIQTLVR